MPRTGPRGTARMWRSCAASGRRSGSRCRRRGRRRGRARRGSAQLLMNGNSANADARAGPVGTGGRAALAPARSQIRTLPSSAPVYSVRPSRLIARLVRLPGVAVQRLGDGAAPDVPDDHAVVLAGRDRGPPVGAERGLHHRAGVAAGGGRAPGRCRGRGSAPSRRCRRAAACDRPGSAPLSAAPAGHRSSGRSVVASRITVRPGIVVTTRLPSCMTHRGHEQVALRDRPRRADRAPARHGRSAER